MFKKLEDILAKKYKGKKFMELHPDQRNNKDLNDAMDDFHKELNEFFGSDSNNLFLLSTMQSKSGSSYGTSRYVGSQGMNPGSVISLFEATLKMAKIAIDKQTASAILGGYQGEEEGDISVEEYKEAASRAMKEVLDGLPVDMQKKAYSKMNSIMEDKGFGSDTIKGVPKRSKKDDDSESDMLDDLLK